MNRFEQARYNESLVIPHADGKRSSTEIAELCGLSPRRVRKILLRLNLPRLNEGAQPREKNHQYKVGRTIHRDGYAYVPAPVGHPLRMSASGKRPRLLREHRVVMEQMLGRYLRPEEIVDHIDGLTLHNAPENLRLFSSNKEHLQQTITGTPRNWSHAGYQNIGVRADLGKAYQPVDRHKAMLKAGDVRLRQILLLALRLGTDSPYLLGTLPHTTKAGIDLSCRSMIERALADLYERWELGPAPLQ